MARCPLSVAIPDALVAAHAKYFGAAGGRWIAALPALVVECLDRWELRIDGVAGCGAVALVVPVARRDGTLAALKVQPVDDETGGEPAALRSWAGRGAVGLLEHDAGSGAMLLERLNADRSLAAVEDDLAAVQVIANLLVELHAVPAPAGMRRLAQLAAAMVAELPRVLPLLSDPAERDLLVTCAVRVGEVVTEPVTERLLHWDLHYDNVLASYRPDPARAWLAIDPKPLTGDPGFELLPALWNRWDDVVATGHVDRAVLRRFDAMTEILALDRQRAASWTLARVLQNALWDVGKFGETTLQAAHRAIADTLLSRRR